MARVSVLGPKGTFSDIAKEKFEEFMNEKYDVFYSKSIKDSIKNEMDAEYVIVPFENSLDGYVTETLDSLIESDYKIIAQINCPVHFKLISNVEIDLIDKVYVQFKARNQCNNLLERFDNIIITESNIYSLEAIKNDVINTAAVVPMHVDSSSFKCVLNNIEDSDNNVTRFFVMTKYDYKSYLDNDIKVSCMVYAIEDKPGILYHILNVFEKNNINLCSILSRPTKKELGNYNFYIEFELKKKDMHKIEVILDDFKKLNEFKIKLFGAYSNIGD